MKKSSTLVIIIPLLVAAGIVGSILVFKSKTSQEQAPVVSANKSVVPTLQGSAGVPKEGFDTSKAQEQKTVQADSPAVSDLSDQLDSVDDDSAEDDFKSLQTDAGQL